MPRACAWRSRSGRWKRAGRVEPCSTHRAPSELQPSMARLYKSGGSAGPRPASECRQPRRVRLRLRHRFLGHVPARQRLRIRAAADLGVQSLRHCVGKAAALAGGHRDRRSIWPATGEQAHAPHLAVARRIGAGGIGFERDVGAAGDHRKPPHHRIIEVLVFHRLQPGRNVLLVPLPQDLVLVGGRTDHHLQPGHIGRCPAGRSGNWRNRTSSCAPR
ncbi:hypothetical protein G6F59_014202 [Rhizopus arrhizus]|nr:hypothetical protein G6F59_014202 [Rhizopus arrhizus]